MRDRLLIVGASGRAAAASAIRAGFDPFVIDLFADADTRRLCPTRRCDPADYPRGFVPLAAEAPPGPWMYTGGLENDPDVVAAISERRELIGNGPDALRTVRDPSRLCATVRANGGRFPETMATGTGPPNGGTWVRKSVASAGGLRVRFAAVGDFDHTAATDRDYLQRYVEGQPMSALFRRDTGEHWLYGLTVQLIGTDWLHAPPFGYSGNVTAGDPARDRRLVSHLGAFAEFELHHGWGVDFIDTGSGVPFTLEVNPRYTAAAEVLEYATGIPYLGPVGPPSGTRAVVGKGIYYAAEPLVFPVSGPWDESLAGCTNVWRRPAFADIPDPGTVIGRGQPVLTIFAEAATEADCTAGLRERAAELDTVFGVPPGGLT